ncbi:MAG: aminotransferase [Oscillospiraceae bacterium]|nr:aminotransferase [Oscillospiraceae bacterium]
MMESQFDRIIDRRGTGSLKYDFAVRRGKPANVLPLWVADMDFQAPPAVLDALRERVDHGIFGYSEPGEGYFEALLGWYQERHGWTPQRRWLVKTPGIVFALAMAVRAYTEIGDGVLIQQPVYYPFSEVIEDNNRVLVSNPLENRGGVYQINFEDFERCIVEHRVKLFLLCSPHNPVGRVWTREELAAMGDICLRHGVIVASDEIHWDFVWGDNRHTVFSTLGEAFEQNCLIFTAPSKTFNMAGLQISNCFIPNPELRRKFRLEIDRAGYSQHNTMGLAACQAAYSRGGAWFDELKDYLWDNISFVRSYLRENLPEIQLVEPQGTYLLWLDFRALNLTEEEREYLIVNKAGLWLDSGAIFGAVGEGFERINIACPRKTLQLALECLEEAIHGRR